MVRLWLSAIVLASGLAQAGTVRGTLTLPAESRRGDGRDASLWRVENGILPIAEPASDPRRQALIVLLPERATTTSVPASGTVVMALHGLRLDPPLVTAPVGATIEFKNDDRVPHTLYLERATSLMPALSTPAGQTRSQRFLAAGEYRVRDEDFPHISGAIVIIDAPYSAKTDERGGFQLEVPEGRYLLRLFVSGAWVHKQAVEVTARPLDLPLKLSSLPREPDRK